MSSASASGKTIAEVQAGTVAASLSEVCVGPAGQTGLVLGHGLDNKLRFRKQLVEASADDRISLGVQYYSALGITAAESRRTLAAAMAWALITASSSAVRIAMPAGVSTVTAATAWELQGPR